MISPWELVCSGFARPIQNIPSQVPRRLRRSLNSLNQMLNLVHVQFNVRIHLHILVVCRVDFVLNILFKIRHLFSSLAIYSTKLMTPKVSSNLPSSPSALS